LRWKNPVGATKKEREVLLHQKDKPDDSQNRDPDTNQAIIKEIKVKEV